MIGIGLVWAVKIGLDWFNAGDAWWRFGGILPAFVYMNAGAGLLWSPNRYTWWNTVFILAFSGLLLAFYLFMHVRHPGFLIELARLPDSLFSVVSLLLLVSAFIVVALSGLRLLCNRQVKAWYCWQPY